MSNHAVRATSANFTNPGIPIPIGLYITLNIEGPIVPGQPISFSWQSFAVTSGEPLDIGTVTASIYLLSRSGDPNPNPLYQFTLPSDPVLASGDYQSKVYMFTPPPDQARAVYRINGAQVLRLTLIGTGTQEGPYSGDGYLNVTWEHVDDTWWEWTVEPYRNIQWKVDHYTFNGVFHNRSKYATMTANISLLETNLTDDDPPKHGYPPDQPAATVVPLQDVLITYGMQDFSKSWRWTIPDIWIPQETSEKLFMYQVRIDMNDEFMNGYTNAGTDGRSSPMPNFVGVFVDVRVSDLKWAANATAAGLMTTAAGLLVIAAIVVWIPVVGWVTATALVAAAAAVATVAHFIGYDIALDPPEPDSHFNDPVKPRTFHLPKILQNHEHLGAIVLTIEHISRIAASVKALGTIENRILGAQAAKNKGALTKQREAYKHIQEELLEDALVIKALGAQADQNLQLGETFSLQASSAALQQILTHGLSDELRQAWVEVEGQAQTFTLLEARLREPSVLGQLIFNRNFLNASIWAAQMAKAASQQKVP